MGQLTDLSRAQDSFFFAITGSFRVVVRKCNFRLLLGNTRPTIERVSGILQTVAVIRQLQLLSNQ
jgi:hypothetical protein